MRADLRKSIRDLWSRAPELTKALCEHHIPAAYRSDYERFYTGVYVDASPATLLRQTLSQEHRAILKHAKYLVRGESGPGDTVDVILYTRLENAEDMTTTWSRSGPRSRSERDFYADIRAFESIGSTYATLNDRSLSPLVIAERVDELHLRRRNRDVALIYSELAIPTRSMSGPTIGF
jgi:hypothetical protein